MNNRWITVVGAALAGAVVTAGSVAVAGHMRSAQDKPPSRARVAFAHELPSLDGAHLKSTLVEVTYEPGGANTAHRHPCPVVGYVLSGRLRMQVKGQPERVFEPGETFYEAPTDVHMVSANASATEPARFLAYFTCDRDTPLSMPVTDARGGAR